MATDLIMEKRGNRLIPTDSIGADTLAGIKEGEQLRVTVRRARNPAHHRKLFALLHVVHGAQDRFSTIEDLLDAIKIATGHYDIWRVGRREIYRPKSIAFASMDQATFEKFYERVVEIILTKMLPGLARADLDRQVYEILDGRRAA